VRGERVKITRITGEDKRLGVFRSKLRRRSRRSPISWRRPPVLYAYVLRRGPAARSRSNLPKLEQPVDMEVSAIVTREDLGQNDRWYVSWPKPISTEGLEAFRSPQ
jgi:hypothetical protein